MTGRITRKRLFAGLIALAMLLAYFPAFAWNTYADDVPEVIEIGSAEELATFAAGVNSGEITGCTAALTADLDFSELEDLLWVGIGTEEKPFIGAFHGGYHSISGLNGSLGLFGHIKDAWIDNLTVDGSITTAEGSDVAGIVGCVEASSTGADATYIGNVGNYATVTSTDGHNVAGIVGHVAQGARVEISFSVNKGAIEGFEYVGGIAGRNQGTLTVETCYNAGSVKATRQDTLSQQTNDSNAGGICGSPCTIKDSYNTGSVIGYHRSGGGGGQIVERGYAYTSGTPTINTCYCLEGSAAQSTGARYNRPPFTGEARFTDGTVQTGLNAYYEVGNPWIEGSKVKVDAEAEPQRYPGLSWEMTDDIEILKPIFIEELKNYADPDDYDELQQGVLETAVTNGIEGIGLATDSASVVLAFNDATAAIDDIPTSKEIQDAKDYLLEYIEDNEYDDFQQLEINEILENANGDIENAKTIGAVDDSVESAKKAIDLIPVSEEVVKANEAKKILRKDIVKANSEVASGKYAEDENMIALAVAIGIANGICDDPNAFEKDVEDADVALWDALRGLKIADNSEREAAIRLIEAKKALNSDIVYANNLINTNDFNEKSVEALNSAIAAAKAVLADKEATMKQVIDATRALADALSGLEASTSVAKGNLLSTMNRVKQSVNKNDYTTSSFTALQNTLNAANKLANDPKATNEALRNAQINVLSAQYNLVRKAANPMKVTKKNKSVKRVKLLVKDQVVKAITVKKAVGKVSFKKMEGSGKFKVNSSNGKITVKKGTKKGTYLLKIRVRAAGNGNYQAAEKIVSVKIAVK